MPLQTLSDALSKWAKLPYAKMLAIALAVVCLFEYRELRKKDVKYDVLYGRYDKAIVKYDSVKTALFYEQIKAERDCHDKIKRMLEKQLLEMENAISEAEKSRRKTEAINRKLTNTIHDER